MKRQAKKRERNTTMRLRNQRRRRMTMMRRLWKSEPRSGSLRAR
jgi:hypothetical protein